MGNYKCLLNVFIMSTNVLSKCFDCKLQNISSSPEIYIFEYIQNAQNVYGYISSLITEGKKWKLFSVFPTPLNASNQKIRKKILVVPGISSSWWCKRREWNVETTSNIHIHFGITTLLQKAAKWHHGGQHLLTLMLWCVRLMCPANTWAWYAKVHTMCIRYRMK